MASQFEGYITQTYAGATIEVHSDWNPPGTGGHVSESFHYSGNALDLHVAVNGSVLPLLDQWIAASRCSSVRGLGGYPFWASRGIHIDCRPTAIRALWWRNAAGEYNESMDAFFKAVA